MDLEGKPIFAILLRVILWTPFEPGPVGRTDEPVVISFTAFAPHRRRDVPLVAAVGLRLRQGWYAMPGAVGLWLWLQPATLRSGSVSVWRDEEDVKRFVGLPRHVATMRRFGPRSDVDVKTWREERFVPAQVRGAVEQTLRTHAGPSAHPSPGTASGA